METTTRSSEARSAHEPTLSLDSLAELDSSELGRLYASGRMPASLSELDGHPRGRMLAVRLLDAGLSARAIRSVAAAGYFPWGGKTFTAASTTRGRGINRVHLGGRHSLFPFLTQVAPSVVDGAPCVVLDYDLADNPFFIRKIHDEVREVSRGLYLGPAMWKADDGPALVLWFALDVRDQASPVGGAN
jgi:hypothetical protein